MYSKGHAGLTLLITSLLMIPFGINETALIIIVFSTGLSSLPDIDMSLRKYSKLLHHRGPTHSILFALIAGISFGLLLYYGYGTLYGFGIGFITAFWGVISHLIGDMFTYHAFKPLWPFSNKEVALGLCSASDRSVNEGLITLGSAAFIFYLLYNEGIIQEILQSLFS